MLFWWWIIALLTTSNIMWKRHVEKHIKLSHIIFVFFLFSKIVECAFSHPGPWNEPHGYGIAFACQKHFDEIQDEKKWYHPMEDKLHQKGLIHVIIRLERLEHGMTNMPLCSHYNQFTHWQYFLILFITWISKSSLEYQIFWITSWEMSFSYSFQTRQIS